VERNNRFLAWLLLGMAIFFFFSSMRQQESLNEAKEKQKQSELQAGKAKRIAEAKALSEKIAVENPQVRIPDEPARQRFTLGSMLPADGYQFLVTLDNQGAMIERIELVSQKKPGEFDFRSLQTKNIAGYLGYLAAEERRGGGLIVHSIPVGSAASLANCNENPGLVGLLAGDVIVGWDGLEGPATLYQLEKVLESLRPGDRLQLQVERGHVMGEPNIGGDAVGEAQSTLPEGSVAAVESTASSAVVSAQAANDDPSEQVAPAAENPTPSAAIQSLTFDAMLTQKPVSILRSEDDFPIEQVKGNYPAGSCGLTLAKIDSKELEEGERTIAGLEQTLRGRWEAKPLAVESGMGIEFTMPLGARLKLAGVDANLELVKQYRLLRTLPERAGNSPDDWQYHIHFTTMVRNLDDKPHDIALRQEGLNGISLEGWWYPTKLSPHFFSSPGARDVIVGDRMSKYSIFMTRGLVDYAKKFPSDPDQLLFGPQDTESKRDVQYIGLDTQVFTAAMLPSPETPDSMRGLQKAKATVINSSLQKPGEFESYRQQAYNTGFWFVTPSQTVAPNSELIRSYRIFAGPKDPELLQAYHLEDAIEYGWQIFGFFAVRLGYILHFFYYLIGNYGIAIMMLTVSVRSLMFPVSRRMAINAQKMQAVQPELAKLRELLKEEPAKMMSAQQMLMKKAGINQLAGCLPAFIQLPIIIGLYRCVSVDVALRQQPLIPGLEWCSNLAGPDMLLDWHRWMPDFIAGRGSGWFGPYLNILPLATIALFIIQQKVLMPKATDEQTRTAQRMMMIMTIMMGVLFFRVPAGLCIYFITSSTWSLVERFLVKRYTPQAEIKTLPDNVVNEIMNAVSKAGPGQRPSLPTPGAADRPKTKTTKPPETFAELLAPFFKQKSNAEASGGANGDPKTGRDRPRPNKGSPNKGTPNKGDKGPNKPKN
jgi:YidC/Oxa1 family membrane protein insertase